MNSANVLFPSDKMCVAPKLSSHGPHGSETPFSEIDIQWSSESKPVGADWILIGLVFSRRNGGGQLGVRGGERTLL